MKKLIALGLALATIAACTTDPYTGEQKISNTAGGAAIGAGVGALAGRLAGGDDRRNSWIGAGVGALVGGAIGAHMDQQEAELRRQLQATGVSVTRQGNNIILNMPSNVTFATDQDSISTQFYSTLNSVAIVLNKYNRTLIDVYGHTDSTGDDNYNYNLSQRRASSVAQYLQSQGVDGRRMKFEGFGETRPIADNATDFGRAQNRRVEILIVPLT